MRLHSRDGLFKKTSRVPPEKLIRLNDTDWMMMQPASISMGCGGRGRNPNPTCPPTSLASHRHRPPQDAHAAVDWYDN